MNALRNAALVVLGCVVAVLLLEGALRLAAWGFLRMRAPTATVGDGITIRVLCLGESTTADMTLGRNGSYPAHLERILNADTPGRFVVINGGVPATTTDKILDALPNNLDTHRPDVVVTMMGINDSPTVDPLFQIHNGSGLKVWRLVRLLALSLRGHAVAEVGDRGPAAVHHSSLLAWKHVLAGEIDQAQPLLDGMLHQDEWPMLKLRALGIQTVADWYAGKMDAARTHHAAFVDYLRRTPRDATAQRYRRLQAILRERGIPLVAVQYPALPVDALADMLDPGAEVVDTEALFLDDLRRGRPGLVYQDLFGGLVGHLTPYGNQRLAERIAPAVLSVVRGHHSMPTQK